MPKDREIKIKIDAVEEAIIEGYAKRTRQSTEDAASILFAIGLDKTMRIVRDELIDRAIKKGKAQ